MTPDETCLLIDGWNKAQKAASGEVAPPTKAEFDELVKLYG